MHRYLIFQLSWPLVYGDKCLLWDLCLFKMPRIGLWTSSGQHFSPVSHTDKRPQMGLFTIAYWDIFELTFVVWEQYESHSFRGFTSIFHDYKLVAFSLKQENTQSSDVHSVNSRISSNLFSNLKNVFLLMIWTVSNLTFTWEWVNMRPSVESTCRQCPLLESNRTTMKTGIVCLQIYEHKAVNWFFWGGSYYITVISHNCCNTTIT